MTTPITDADLARIKEAAEKATPGPWSVTHNSWQYSTVYDMDMNPVAEFQIDGDADEDTQDKFEQIKEGNAEFTMLAGNHMDTLIARVEAAEAKLARAREALLSIDAVSIDYGHIESAARTMKELSARAYRETE